MPSRVPRSALLATAAVSAVAIAAPAAHAASYSPMDEQALTSSIQGDRFEIIGGRMAAARGTDPAVRALGRRLHRDHVKSLKESAALARRLGISVPKQPTPSERWELGVVRQSGGSTFDRLYTTLEVQDHRQDIMEAQDEVKGGANPAVVADARQEIPMLRTHLRLSKRARAAVQH
jgi:putative membrane protein